MRLNKIPAIEKLLKEMEFIGNNDQGIVFLS